MKIFNKVIWNTDPPVNKSDIWYDGKTLNVYKGDIWTPITSDLNVKFEDVASDVEVVKFPVLYYNTSQDLSDGSINQVIRNLKLDTRYLKLEDYESSFYDDSELRKELANKVDASFVAAALEGYATKDEVKPYDDTEIKAAISLRNVGAVDTDESVDEPEIGGGGGGDDTLLRMLAGQSANFVYEDVDGKIHSITGGVSYNWADSREISSSLKKILYMSFAPTSQTMQSTFQNAINLEEIYAKPILPARLNDGGYVEVLSGFFEKCAKMKDFGFVKYWDVSHVTNIASMFSSTSAQTYPVEDWNTASLIKMIGAFGNNLALKYLDLSKWDTSKVTDMTNFVFECLNIETLGLPSIPSGLPHAVILGYGINTLQNIFMAEDSLIKGSIMFDTSPQLTTESVQTLIDHLDTENVGTLTLHANAKARYDAQYGTGACATAVTSKGWTLA